MNLEQLHITEFYNDKIEMKGVFTIKELFEDFIVKEITGDRVCDEEDIIDYKAVDEFAESIDSYFQDLENHQSAEIDLCNNDIAFIKLKLSLNYLSNELLNKQSKDNIEGTLLLFKISKLSREQRSILHNLFRIHPLLDTTTTENGVVEAYFGDKTSRIYRMSLKKIGKDTVEACNILAGMLKIPRNNVKFAGNKDRRGITYQEISLKGCSFYDLYSQAARFKAEESNLALFRIRRSNSEIKLGELQGNHFQIKVKINKEMEESERTRIIESVDISKLEKGFINYFGSQRFGKSLNNHKIGEYILDKDYDAAIHEIMKPSESEFGCIKEAKVAFANQEYETASTLFPKRFYTEIWICRAKQKGLKSQKIVMSLKREILKLYLHAYQSFIFNKEASQRMKLAHKNLLDLSVEENNTIALEIKDSKHCKGGNRRMIEVPHNINMKKDSHSFSISFNLNPSSYATMALRELIGNDVFYTPDLKFDSV